MGMVVKFRRFGGFLSQNKSKNPIITEEKGLQTENRKCSKAIEGHSEIEGFEENSKGTEKELPLK